MMIAPDVFVKQFEDVPYLDLIRERDRLIGEVRRFEVKEMAGDRSDPAWGVCPMPDVRYQMNLEYLAGLCRLMQERYNEEYVGEDRTLKDDAEKKGVRSGRKTTDPDRAEKNFNATLELLRQVGKKEE